MATPSKLLKLPGFCLNYLTGDKFVRHQVHYRLFPLYYRVRFVLFPGYSGAQKKLFVDMGANVGGGYDYFSKVFKPADFSWHFFEPNPNCMKALEAKLAGVDFPHGRQMFEEAVWVKDEPLTFYGLSETGNATSEGASVLASHNSAFYEAGAQGTLTVQGRDIAAYLREAEAAYDHVVIKMDIEGAELDVLEYLWRQPEIFSKPTVIFIEFHALYLKEKEEAVAKAREKAIWKNAPKNVTLLEWF